MTLTEWLRLATALVTLTGAVFLVIEQRKHSARRGFAIYAASIAGISALFRLLVASYDLWPPTMQQVLRSGDISATIVMLTMVALVLAVRGMR